jgi:glycosyltransferase involved in cell wall biosynthesis
VTGSPQMPRQMPLRILHVTRTASTVDAFLRPLLSEHLARGHHVELAFGLSSTPTVDFGIPVHPYPIHRSLRPDRLVHTVEGLKRIIQQGRFDVIVAHMVLAGFATRLAFRMAGRPGRLLYASHGLPCYLTRNHTARWLALNLERAMSLWTDGMIVLNTFDFRMATKHRLAGAQGEVHFLHTVGIPYAQIVHKAEALDRQAYRRGLGLAPDVPVITYAGRFVRPKGVQTFLEIARHLARTGAVVQFVIAGSGPLDGFVRRFIETQHLAEHTRLLGWYDDMPRLLAASDILCLPTFYEGAPVILQEAMAAGTVVVASDVPGPQDLIDHHHTGILVPPGDTDRFCSTLADLLADEPQRKELGLSARAHAAQFDVSIWAPAWAEAIEEVALHEPQDPRPLRHAG